MKLFTLLIISILFAGCFNREEAAERYFNMGVSDDSEVNYILGMINYSKAIELNPSLVVAYNNRGYARFVLKDTNGALDDYNIAIKCNNYAHIAAAHTSFWHSASS